MNKGIVLYLFIGLSIFVMACGEDTGTTTAIEGFESGSLSLYKTPMGETNFAIKTTAAHDGSSCLFGSGNSLSGDPLGGKWIYRDDAAVATKQGDRLSLWVMRSNVDSGATAATAGASYMGFGASAAGCYAVAIQCQTSEFRISKVVDYLTSTGVGTITLKAVPQTYIANRWYKIVVKWDVGGLITAYLYDSDGSTLLNTVSATDNTWTSGGIGFRGFYRDYYFDTYERYVQP